MTERRMGLRKATGKADSATAQVVAYIDQAPAQQRELLAELRQWIADAIPRATEQFVATSKLVMFTRDGQWLAGFASRKKGPVFYLCVDDILDRHRKKLGKLVTGVGCIEYRASKELPFPAVQTVVKQALSDLGKHGTAR